MNDENLTEAERHIVEVFKEVKKFNRFALSKNNSSDVRKNIRKVTYYLFEIVKAAKLAPVTMDIDCTTPQIMSKRGLIKFDGEDPE